MTDIQRYSNPVARDGDFADPFVLRFNGRYYLYCTNPDVRCWSSSDLLHWDLEGPTIAPGTFGDLVPFAPEVVYADGWFYMYTSPSGFGHYVLRSDSPTGPFEPVTENVGHAIDGHVLIDDDGRWYFYWAGDEGIWGCEMPTPTTFGEPVLTAAFMHGWTEGPFVVKRDGWYHLTLTGNHYLSAGYRINAAVSRHPLRGYVDSPLNPVVVSTTKPLVGLGHSSTVLGPDLVSYYLAFHNLNADRSRDLDIDRVAWNGPALQVLGPTTNAPAPQPPAAAATWEAGTSGWTATGGTLVAADGFGHLSGEGAVARWDAGAVDGVFTTELNLAAPGSGPRRYGLLVGTGPGSLVVRFDSAAGTVSLMADDHGERVLASSRLPHGYAHDALHCVRLVSDGGALRVLVDGRDSLAAEVAAPPSGHLGFFTADGSLRLGYVAVTHARESEATPTARKPVPGRWWATLTATPGVEVAVADGPVPYGRLVLASGDEAGYDLDVPDAGAYTVFVTGDLSGSALAIAVDGVRVGLGAPDAHVLAVPVQLAAGVHRLDLQAEAGHSVLDLVSVLPSPASKAEVELAGPVAAIGDAKLLLGDENLHDCVVEALVSIGVDGPDGHGDLLFRAGQLAEGFEGDDEVPAPDYLLGYSVQLRPDRVVLARHDYDETILASRTVALDLSVPHRVGVRAQGSRLTVQVDGLEPIEHDDPLPHLVGGVGLRAHRASVRAEAISIRG